LLLLTDIKQAKKERVIEKTSKVNHHATRYHTPKANACPIPRAMTQLSSTCQLLLMEIHPVDVQIHHQQCLCQLKKRVKDQLSKKLLESIPLHGMH